MAIFGDVLVSVSAPTCLVILIIAIIFFATERFKSGIVAIASSALMVLCGFITPSEFAGGFSSSVTIAVVGISVVGASIANTGCATFIGKKILSLVHLSEKGTICLLFALISMLSAFLNNISSVVLGIYLAIAICKSSEGKFQQRNFVMVMGTAAACGGGLSMIGTSTQLVVAALLPDMGLEMHMWDLTRPGFIVPIVFIAWYYFFGYKLMVKTFDFPEPEEMKAFGSDALKEFNPRSFKAWLPVIILIVCITLFSNGWNIAIVAMICMCTVIITGCISFKEAIEAIDWNLFFLLAGGVGLAAGFQNSGAAEMVANFVVSTLGSAPAIVYLIIFSLLASAISNIMSNTATALIITPIAAAVATSIGVSAYPMILCVVWGANMAFSTPIGTAAMAMTMIGGYRFKDYTVINIVPNIVAAVVLALLTPLFWPL